MPSEIPDSDEESEYDFAQTKLAPEPPSPLHSEEKTFSVSDRGLDVNFDDFISPTQSATHGSSQLEPTKCRLNSLQTPSRKDLDNGMALLHGSYDGVEDLDQATGEGIFPAPCVGRKKRTHSEIDRGGAQSNMNKSSTKRAKTYGSGSRCLESDQRMEEYQQMTHTGARGISHALSSSRDLKNEDCGTNVALVGESPSKSISLLGDSAPSVAHMISTSRSSMGGYQSINLDFRGTGSGLDVSTNPFGAPSQPSVCTGVDYLDDDRRAELSSTVPLSASPRRPGRDATSPFTDSGSVADGIGGAPASLKVSTLDVSQPIDAQMLMSPASDAEKNLPSSACGRMVGCATDAISDQVYDVANDDTANSTVPTAALKKRGRKQKSSRKPSVISDQNELALEQNSDDPAVGLPKEAYKPRPSRSRDSTVEPVNCEVVDEGDQQTKTKGRKKSTKSTENSLELGTSSNQLTSELNLSDEATIGLPKENYKPRPSRRRSKMATDATETATEASNRVVENMESAERCSVSPSRDKLPLESRRLCEIATPRVKKGRKAKVKRAKTSAAGLLKKSEPMISDGEDDVVWMDTKPAKVKLDLPVNVPGAKPVKAECVASDETNNDFTHVSKSPAEEAQEEAAHPVAPAYQTVTVEIPGHIDREASDSKKRGRKPKQGPDIAQDEAAAAPPPPLSPSPQKQLQPSTILTDKDPNVALPSPVATEKPAVVASSPPTKTVSRITHSPINPNRGKVLYRVGLSRRSAIPPLLKVVRPPAKQAMQTEKQDLDEDGKPVDLVAETMRKWREMGALD